MNWYVLTLVRYVEGGRILRYVDGFRAPCEDVARAHLLDRNEIPDDFEPEVEKCLTENQNALAGHLYTLRCSELNEWSLEKFVEWMRQPAYQGAKR